MQSMQIHRYVAAPFNIEFEIFLKGTVADEWLGIDFLFKVLKSSFSQSNRWT
jgi:hypothetical protein